MLASAQSGLPSPFLQPRPPRPGDSALVVFAWPAGEEGRGHLLRLLLPALTGSWAQLRLGFPPQAIRMPVRDLCPAKMAQVKCPVMTDRGSGLESGSWAAPVSSGPSHRWAGGGEVRPVRRSARPGPQAPARGSFIPFCSDSFHTHMEAFSCMAAPGE